jgi:hypothetical protein
MLAVKYLDRIDITFLPTDAIQFATEIGAVKGSQPGVVYEIHLATNPRNKDGYRSKLDADVRKLRQMGAVLVGVPNKEGKGFFKERAAKEKESSFPTIGGDVPDKADAAAKTTGKSK